MNLDTIAEIIVRERYVTEGRGAMPPEIREASMRMVREIAYRTIELLGGLDPNVGHGRIDLDIELPGPEEVLEVFAECASDETVGVAIGQGDERAPGAVELDRAKARQIIGALAMFVLAGPLDEAPAVLEGQ